jgi:hypothetical protein
MGGGMMGIGGGGGSICPSIGLGHHHHHNVLQPIASKYVSVAISPSVLLQYLEKVTPEEWPTNEDSMSPTAANNNGVPTIVRAIDRFESTDATELGFDVDTLIAVANEYASGWWYGVEIASAEWGEGGGGDGGKEEVPFAWSGWFPNTYVKIFGGGNGDSWRGQARLVQRR